MTRTRTVITALSCLSVLALGACSDDDPEPKFAPTPSTSASTDVTSSPAALSPEETVKAWIDAQNEAFKTGNTGDLRALSLDPCEACDQFIEPIEQVFADGGYFKTAGWTMDGSKLRDPDRVPRVVNTAITIAGGETLKSKGAEPVVYESEKHIMVFKLVPQGSGWAVSFIGFIS